MLGKVVLISALTVAGFAALIVWLHDKPAVVQQMAKLVPHFTPVARFIHSWLSSDEQKQQDGTKQSRMFTVEELAMFKGGESGGPYLAILGQVFDVSRGLKHYGPGGHYSGLAGRDASRSFVTGDFSEEAVTDAVDGLAASDYLALQDWSDFYKKDYVYVGKLIGRYYDSTGAETEYRRMVRSYIESARHEKSDEEQEKKRFPPCNIEWNQETGRRFWCTKLSGGIQRDWEGVPRRMYHAGKKQPNCVCVNTPDLEDPRLKSYPGCPAEATSCELKN